jgi:hypothetical protein
MNEQELRENHEKALRMKEEAKGLTPQAQGEPEAEELPDFVQAALDEELG